jgi:hypothetical protein
MMAKMTMMTNCKALIIITAALAASLHETAAFVPSPTRLIFTKSSMKTIPTQQMHRTISPKQPLTSLQMSYQLPPSPKGPFDELKSILPTIGTGILVALFFASPLGAIFFGIFNSLFVLALLTPFVLFVGFQIWSALYTVEATCPSCGQVPVRALKNGDPTVCLNCGAFSRVNEAGDGLELCNNPNDILNEGSLFDALFGGGSMGGMSDFGVMDSSRPSEEEKKKVKRQGTIIDVEVERD